MISIEGLLKEFVDNQGEVKVAVDRLDLDIREGEFFTLLGPSGCGKTTTLRCVAGLERPTAGSISVGGRLVYRDRVLVPTHDRRLGMVFQSYAVWPHMTVAENVGFPLTVGEEKVARAEIRRRVSETLELVGLGGLEERMATQLSGGQQQRLSLARALVRRPSLLLLDEPLSNLDAKLRDRMRAELRAIQKEVGITTLFVTHDQIEALSMSDRIAVMRDGRIEQLGSPKDIYHRPKSAFVAEFIGGANLVHGRALGAGPGQVSVETPYGTIAGVAEVPVAAGDEVLIAVRVEDIVLHASKEAGAAERGSRLEGRIALALFTGSATDVLVALPGGGLQVRVPSRLDLRDGADVVAELPADHVRVLPKDPTVAPGSVRARSAWERLAAGGSA